ncbi:hypothetical protein GUY61_13545, partial [Streptomyces sp. GC420]|nr:hypothetical protein [Streptomyces sp. GC420]
MSAVTVSALALLVPAAQAAVPGDDGTVKIHDAETGEDLVKNEPHVCTFYLDAFGFDEGQQVDWRIVGMPPTGSQDEVAESGSLALDEDGHARTDDMTLPDGHYKLIWEFDGENGEAKHKVFWTDCEDEEEPGGGSSGTPSGSASPSASATPSEDPSEPAPSSSSSAGAS